MEIFSKIVAMVDGLVWGPWLLVLLLGTHIFMTVYTRGIQRKLWLGIKLSVANDNESSGDVSQFGALTTALAATIGTGNIVGVGTAVALGGPGAVLWMWLSGIFGIATKYAETLISVKYRVRTQKGLMLGGAMFALERGLKMRWLGIVFALLAALAAFGIGSAVQPNAVTNIVCRTFDISKNFVGLAITALVALVIIGGIKSIARVCEKLIPLMTIFYVLGCVTLLAMHGDYLGAAIKEIIGNAFKPQAAGGGLFGYGIMAAARYGVARGLFSNESGMGSAPIVAAAAKTRNAPRQALVSMTGTFWDTVVICLMTGLVVVSAAIANPQIEYSDGGALTYAAFNQIPFGKYALTFGIITFAFTTTIGWSYYGERAAEYLFGHKANIPYRMLYTFTVYFGCLMPLGLVWDLADILNGLMIIPNIVALLCLRKLIFSETREYVYETANAIDKIDATPIPSVDEVTAERSEYYDE